MNDYGYYIVVSTDVAGNDYVHYCDTLKDAQWFARKHSKCGHILRCSIYVLLLRCSDPSKKSARLVS